MNRSVLLVGHCGVDGPRLQKYVESLDGQFECRSAASEEELDQAVRHGEMVRVETGGRGGAAVRAFGQSLDPQHRRAMGNERFDGGKHDSASGRGGLVTAR